VIIIGLNSTYDRTMTIRIYRYQVYWFRIEGVEIAYSMGSHLCKL